MHIWNPHALARDIRSHRIGVAARWAHALLMLLGFVLCWLGVDDDRFHPLVNASCIAGAQAGAVYVCYCANTYGDRRDFWMRLCLLGVPVGLRCLCGVMSVMVFASLPLDAQWPVVGRAAEMLQWLSGAPPVGVLTVAMLFWGWRTSVHLERVSRACARQA